MRRVIGALRAGGLPATIRVLDESARTAADAATALGIDVGQIASSLVFRLPGDLPLLVITSGRHRVDVARVVDALGISDLHRADADFVRSWSGFAIGGVSPVGWRTDLARVPPTGPHVRGPATVIDAALADYATLWAAAGHPHAVFETTFGDLVSLTCARALEVGE